MININYKKLLENAPYGYTLHKIILDTDITPQNFEYIEINNAFEVITGLNKEQIIGKKILDLFPNMKGNNFALVKHYENIALNSGELEFDAYLEDLNRWYKVKIFSHEKYFLIKNIM
ncbi:MULTISPECIES: PAS domain S-box protein [Clostridium]|uniref:PAS domain-containing protein n=1 Tax=Clostridium beijerinckii TaxID=1520 RepID=A0A1S9N662_CLOBE|nr:MULTISPECIES: PAS domain S-box protein [Clostridium]EKQ57744.1 MAG: PAS domain S-box [Clostridium sp. Maddingley MBC34-26]OOP72925.1 hypothetical protein CBEIBR21_14055 [Clostridium beijerinckii]